MVFIIDVRRESLKERVLLAIGGLLHDIGKVLQRAGIEERDYEEFNYQHAKLSYSFIDEVLKEKLGEDAQKVLAGAYHHKPESENSLFAYIYRLADYFGSSERSLRQEEEKVKLLRPIFPIINLEGKYGEGKWTHYYKLEPLNVDFDEAQGYKVVYPENYEGKIGAKISEGEQKKIEQKIKESYQKLLEGFRQNLKSIDFSNLEKAFERVYYSFYKYFWCVPASTWDQENKDSHYPDISLFDHSRVVACLSTSLYTEYNKRVIEPLLGKRIDYKNVGERLKFVIIDGDITGIQSFLYNLYNYKGFAKRLRGKSLFLALLPELVGRYVLKELGYPLVNLLYSGGGKFWAIVGYEEGIEERLKEIERNVEKALVKKFNGALGFVLSFQEFNANYLRIEKEGGGYKSRFREVIKELYSKVEKKKKRKFLRVFEEFEELANKDWEMLESKVPCPSCGSVFVKEELDEEGEQRVCEVCEGFGKLGSHAPKAKYLLFTEDKNHADFYIDGLNIGVKFLMEFENHRGFLYAINSTNFEGADGFKFIARAVPLDEEGNVLEFIRLVQEGESGYELLGYVRADVDNLGYIFSCGLGEDFSISRVATLSRSLDLFFSGVVNSIIKEKFENKIYTVYSGGDDLFLIGYWEDALEAIKTIRVEFKEYTANSGVFDLSVGVFLARAKYPVRFGADGAGEEEDKAKKEKPAVCVLSEVLKWEELKHLMEEKLAKTNYENYHRSFVYKIYQILKQNVVRANNEEKINMRFYPLLYYFTYRNLEEKKAEEFINLLVEREQDYNIVPKKARFLLKYILMKTRQKIRAKGVIIIMCKEV